MGPAGFFLGVGNEGGLTDGSTPAGSRGRTLVRVWGEAPEADDIFSK